MKKLLVTILFLASLCYAQLPDITKKYRAGEVGDSLLVSIIKFDTTATMFQRGDSLYLFSPALGDTIALERLLNSNISYRWIEDGATVTLSGVLVDTLGIATDTTMTFELSIGGSGRYTTILKVDTTIIATHKSVAESLAAYVDPDTFWVGTILLGSPSFDPLDSLYLADSPYLIPYRAAGGGGEGDYVLMYYPDTTGVTGLATLAYVSAITDTLWSIDPDTLWSVNPDTIWSINPDTVWSVSPDTVASYSAIGDSVALRLLLTAFVDSLLNYVNFDSLWGVDPDTVQKVINLAWKNDNGATATYSSGAYDKIKWRYAYGIDVSMLEPAPPDSFVIHVEIDTAEIATIKALADSILSAKAYGIQAAATVLGSPTYAAFGDSVWFSAGYGMTVSVTGPSPGEYDVSVLIKADTTYLQTKDGIEWNKFEADSVILSNGTSGYVVSDLQDAFDGDYYAITEATGTPGIDLKVYFTVGTKFNRVNIIGYYDGTATHGVSIQLYNWSTTAWDDYDLMPTAVDLQNFDFDIYSNTSSPYVNNSTDVAIVRFVHEMAGNASHSMYLDCVALYRNR